MKKAILMTECGTLYHGETFGSEGEWVGEIVFNTGMTGYQEVLTDPSYRGQLIVFTNPHIGNYGVNPQDYESDHIWAEGLVARDYHEGYSNFRADRSLGQFLADAGKMGITGIDTRKLTCEIREKGSLVGIISSVTFDPRELQSKIAEFGSMEGKDLVSDLRVQRPDYYPAEGFSQKKRIALLDLGCKENIIRCLTRRGADIHCFNLRSSLDDIAAVHPDGILVSNGPGDPAAVAVAVDLLKKLIPLYPIMGICLGHQLLSLAAGARTLKLKYGHHGLNHPVKDLVQDKIYITSQNHNFAVDPDSVNDAAIDITHINLNDQTVEGMRLRSWPVFSVQYHPEAAPGPHDAEPVFDQFWSLINQS